MADNMASVSRIPGGANCKGPLFEIKMIAALYLRGLKGGQPFQLASNVKGAGALDDIVFRCKMADRWYTLFVQLKHREGKTPMLQYNAFRQPTGKPNKKSKSTFSLVKYFQSYLEISLAKKANGEEGVNLFDGALEDSTYVIFTNAAPNDFLKPWICVEDKIFLNTFLSFEGGSVLRFDPNRDKNLVEMLQSRWVELARLDKFREAITELDCDKEIGSFMERLRIFCGQPSESKLQSVVEKELGYLKDNICLANKLEHLAECFIDNVKIWSESITCEILHESSDILLRAQGKVIVETLTSVEERVFRLDVTFEPSILSAWKEKIDQFRLVYVESSESSLRLSCTKIFQAIGSLYIVFSLTTLEKNLDAVISECKHGDQKTVIIIWNYEKEVICVDKVKRVVDILNEKKKKIVILSYFADTKNPLTLGNLSSWHSVRDTFEFSQIDETSRNKILATTFLLQGLEVSFNQYLDGCSDKSTDLLSASSVVKILESGSNMSVGPILTSTVEHYVPRVLEASSTLKYTIFEGCSESITIVNSEICDVIRSVTMQSCMMSINHQDIRDILEYNRSQSPLDSRVGEERIFLGATFLIGNYECNFLHFRKKAIALRIRPQLDTPDQRFLVGWYVFVFDKTSEEEMELVKKSQDARHILKFEGKYLLWLKSEGKLDTIRKHIDENKVTPIDLCIGSESDDRLFLICAEPGMGKTTLVSENAFHTKKVLPYFWVIVLSLHDHDTLFSENVHENVVEFLAAAIGIKTQELQKSILKFALEVSGNVVVILDGVDEISYRYFEHCIVLISNLLKTKAKQILVSSRNTMRCKLEDEFKRLAVKIRKLNESEQRSYLKMSWENVSVITVEELEDFITVLLAKTSKDMSDREKCFLGTPLQLRMMAEVFEDNVKVLGYSSALPAKLDLLHLMKAFVDKKIDIFVHEKLKISRNDNNKKSHIEDQTKKLLKTHGIVALFSIIDKEVLGKLHNKKIRQKALKFLENIESCKYNTGIIDRVVNFKPRFIHRLFAEYFSARWFAKNFADNKDFLEDNLYGDSFSGIRTFFDRLLAEPCELHTAVLNENLSGVRKMIEDKFYLNSKDKGNRTALHLASSFLPSKDKVETARTCGLLDMFINKNPDFSLSDKVLNRSPLQYADITQSWTALNMLLPYYSPDPKACLTKTVANIGNKEMLEHIFIHDLHTLTKFCLEHGLDIDIDELTTDRENVLLTLLSFGSHRVLSVIIGTDHAGDGNLLHHFAAIGDVNTVESLILEVEEPRRSSYVNLKNKHGHPALYYACLAGRDTVLSVLLKHGADLEYPHERVGMPLSSAAMIGHVKVIRVLLDSVADKSTFILACPYDGHTALIAASLGGHGKVISLLLENLDAKEKAAFIRAGNAKGFSPLLEACSRGHENAVRALLDAVDDAEKEAFVTTPRQDGRNALLEAVYSEKSNVVEILLDTLSETAKADYVKSFSAGITALFAAAWLGNINIIRVLIEAVKITERADFITARDKDGKTALHGAAARGRTEAMKFLVLTLGDLDNTRIADFIDSRNNEGHNALIVAASGGHTEFSIALLDFVNSKEKVPFLLKSRAIHEASGEGHAQTVDALLNILNASEKVEYFEKIRYNGCTDLHAAAAQGKVDVIRVLLTKANACRKGEYVRTATVEGLNALHVAVHYNRLKAVETLLTEMDPRQRADCINDRDNNGSSVLHSAVLTESLQLVKNLVEKGGKVTATDNDLETPLMVAVMTGQFDIALYLLNSVDPEKDGMSKAEFLEMKDVRGKGALDCEENSAILLSLLTD